MNAPRARILLVEDDGLNRALASATLQRATDPRLRWATVTVATDLASAREQVGVEAFDLVILDHQLPDGNGLALLDQLRDPRPKVVMLSAHVLPHVQQAALAAGCDAFLGKPYQPAELVGALTALLDAPGR